MASTPQHLTAPTFWASVSEGSATQGRVILALVMREVKTRFGKERLGYLWAFIEPCMYMLVFVALLSFRSRPIPGGMHVMLFLVTGIAPFMLFSGIVTRNLGAILGNQQLLYFPQVKMIDFFIARVVLEVLTWIVVFAALCMIIHAAGIPVRIENPLGVIVAILLVALLGLGYGLILGVISPLWPTLERVVPYVFIKPLFFTSGLFFTADMVPWDIRDVLLLNAILHLSEMLRSAFFVGFESRYVDMDYVLLQIVISICVGIVLLKGLENKLLAAAHDQ